MQSRSPSDPCTSASCAKTGLSLASVATVTSASTHTARKSSQRLINFTLLSKSRVLTTSIKARTAVNSTEKSSVHMESAVTSVTSTAPSRKSTGTTTRLICQLWPSHSWTFCLRLRAHPTVMSPFAKILWTSLSSLSLKLRAAAESCPLRHPQATSKKVARRRRLLMSPPMATQRSSSFNMRCSRSFQRVED